MSDDTEIMFLRRKALATEEELKRTKEQLRKLRAAVIDWATAGSASNPTPVERAQHVLFSVYRELCDSSSVHQRIAGGGHA